MRCGCSGPTSRAAAGYSNRTSPNASRPPTSCITTNMATEAGLIPAKLSESIRAKVTAGFAKLVELVNH